MLAPDVDDRDFGAGSWVRGWLACVWWVTAMAPSFGLVQPTSERHRDHFPEGFVSSTQTLLTRSTNASAVGG